MKLKDKIGQGLLDAPDDVYEMNKMKKGGLFNPNYNFKNNQNN